MFKQVSKRDFLVRRGRNSRILIRAIEQNVFDEKTEDHPKTQNPKTPILRFENCLKLYCIVINIAT